jgi:2OG-Fe(II) oxygenase superfamily
MEYLDLQCLEKISSEEFRARQPYPWASLQGVLTPEGYERLRQTLPEAAQFERHVGLKRAYGQASHDRYMLHYFPALAVAEPWKELIAELNGEGYQRFLRRMLGPRQFILSMEWHYSWQGCSVSPHCDAARKIATHLFYFNTEDDWKPEWGGETMVLDSGRRLPTHSAPAFEELRVVAAPVPIGNCSLFFQRTPHSWHGVRPLRCPPERMRKLFHVTINVPGFQVWWRRVRGKDPDGFRFDGSDQEIGSANEAGAGM